MALAALTFAAVGMAGAVMVIELGWLHGDVHLVFDLVTSRALAERGLLRRLHRSLKLNYIGNGATIGKKVMKIRALSLVHHRLSLPPAARSALC